MEYPSNLKAVVDLNVDWTRVRHSRFGGIGFHVVPEQATSVAAEERARHWRELAPSFARVNHRQDCSREQLRDFADFLLQMRETRTELYITTWNPPDLGSGAPRRDYAERIADQLAYLVFERGCDHLRTYCMANELSLGGWGALRWDMEKFADYHRELRRAFDARGLPVLLLASDASPHASWGTLKWCLQHMDDVTGIYGAHHYFNEHPPEDPALYPWFRKQCVNAVGSARESGKDFIVGEFGAAQNLGHFTPPGGGHLDTCRYFDTPAEPMVGVQLADGIAAMIDAGVYACGYWTFADMAEKPESANRNQWGILAEQNGHVRPRTIYPVMGLLARHFCGPATIVAAESSETSTHIAAVRRPAGDGAVLIVHRGDKRVRARVRLSSPSAADIRVFAYNPLEYADNPCPIAGRLPDPVAVIPAHTDSFELDLPTQSVAILACDASVCGASS